jgi:hypothetical protein
MSFLGVFALFLVGVLVRLLPFSERENPRNHGISWCLGGFRNPSAWPEDCKTPGPERETLENTHIRALEKRQKSRLRPVKTRIRNDVGDLYFVAVRCTGRRQTRAPINQNGKLASRFPGFPGLQRFLSDRSVGQVGASTRALTAANPEGFEGVDVTSSETSVDRLRVLRTRPRPRWPPPWP